MKKLTGLLFCIAMLFSMTACGSKVNDDALDAFEAAIQNMASMKSADYSISMKGNNEGLDQVITLDGSYNLETAKPLFSAALSIESNGEKQDGTIQFYIDGENMYLNLMDIMKQKQSLTDVLQGQAIPSLDTAKDTFALPKDEMKKFLTEAKLDGDTLTLAFDCDKLMESAKTANSSQKELIGTTTINEFKLVMTLKDKVMQKTTISMDVNQLVDDEKTNVKADVDIEFKNINKVKTITFPDFSTYITSEAGLLSNFQ